MQRFVLRQNVAVLRRYLETQTDNRMRRTVLQLLRQAERDLALLEAELLGARARTESPIADAARHHMPTPRLLASTFLREFEAAPEPFLLIDPRPGLHIIDATDAYARATLTTRQDLAGEKLFKAFPDNPGDREADGVHNLHASLCRVMDTQQPHRMPVQRYDVRDADGGFVERYWQPVNTPLFDATGTIIHILHHVEPVAE